MLRAVCIISQGSHHSVPTTDIEYHPKNQAINSEFVCAVPGLVGTMNHSEKNHKLLNIYGMVKSNSTLEDYAVDEQNFEMRAV